MSKLQTLKMRSTARGMKMRRTIAHSPPFTGSHPTSTDGRPTKQLPAGGYMTG